MFRFEVVRCLFCATKDAGTTAGNLNAAALYRLMAWLSPAYPIGAFSYSSGIEWAVEAGDVTDAATFERWLVVMIADGSGFCDAVFFVHAHRAVAQRNDEALRAVAELAAVFAPSQERHLETTAQGRAFLDATRAAWPTPALDRLLAVWDGAVALPVAVAATSAGHDIALAPALQWRPARCQSPTPVRTRPPARRPDRMSTRRGRL